MLIILLYFCITTVYSYDQNELMTKLSEETWNKTPPVAQQHLLALDTLVKKQQALIEKLKRDINDLKNSSPYEHVIHPICRNDLH